jgi:enoyl-[acyl-carrier-protein] reductase (NADH)
MRRQLASELGWGRPRRRPAERRCARTLPVEIDGGEQIAEGIAHAILLGRAATLEDVGQIAAFVASNHARTMTAAIVNVSAARID